MTWYPLIGRTSGTKQITDCSKEIKITSIATDDAGCIVESWSVIIAQLIIVQRSMSFFSQPKFYRIQLTHCYAEWNKTYSQTGRKKSHISILYLYYSCLHNTTVRLLQVQCCITFIVCISPTCRWLCSLQQSNCAQPQLNIKFNLQYIRQISLSGDLLHKQQRVSLLAANH